MLSNKHKLSKQNCNSVSCSRVMVMWPIWCLSGTVVAQSWANMFVTVMSQHVRDNRRAFTWSTAKKLRILFAHALSLQACPSVHGISRLASPLPLRSCSPTFEPCANSTSALLWPMSFFLYTVSVKQCSCPKEPWEGSKMWGPVSIAGDKREPEV